MFNNIKYYNEYNTELDNILKLLEKQFNQEKKITSNIDFLSNICNQSYQVMINRDFSIKWMETQIALSIESITIKDKVLNAINEIVENTSNFLVEDALKQSEIFWNDINLINDDQI